jgi:hypothetical protein
MSKNIAPDQIFFIHIFRQKRIKCWFKVFLFTFYLRVDHLPLIHFGVLWLEHFRPARHSWTGLTGLHNRSDRSPLCFLLHRALILLRVADLPPESRGLYCDLNTSLPSASFSSTTSLDQILSSQLLGLSSPMITFLPLVDSACSGRTNTFAPCRSMVLIGNRSLSTYICLRHNWPSLIANCICH